MKRKKKRLKPLQNSMSLQDERERTPEARPTTRASAPRRSSKPEDLPSVARIRLTSLLGNDLAKVRIHRDEAAAEEAAEIGAAAFTRDRDIYFGKERFAPDKPEGMRLLAHEVAHTIQSDNAVSSGLSSTEASLENEAERVSRSVREGTSARVALQSRGEVLLEEEEAEAVPTITKHPGEITPALGRGSLQVGAATVSFRYDAGKQGEQVTLVLDVPKGVEAALTPMTHEGDMEIDDPGGGGARKIRITATSGTGSVPRVRAQLSEGSTTLIAVFQFTA